MLPLEEHLLRREIAASDCDPVNERDPAKTVGARANAYWLLHEKTMARDAKRTGEKRGFSGVKTLAAAYRNC